MIYIEIIIPSARQAYQLIVDRENAVFREILFGLKTIFGHGKLMMKERGEVTEIELNPSSIDLNSCLNKMNQYCYRTGSIIHHLFIPLIFLHPKNRSQWFPDTTAPTTQSQYLSK